MKKKNIVLIVLVLLIVGVAVAYAAFSQKLTINGTAKIDSSWDVEITGITLDDTSVGATNETEPTFTNTTATFNVKLAKPGDTAVYKVTVENKGKVDAKLNSVTDLTSVNETQPTEITYTIDASANDTLASGENKVYTVTVTWDASSTAVPTTTSKTATIELNYVQAD